MCRRRWLSVCGRRWLSRKRGRWKRCGESEGCERRWRNGWRRRESSRTGICDSLSFSRFDVGGIVVGVETIRWNNVDVPVWTGLLAASKEVSILFVVVNVLLICGFVTVVLVTAVDVVVVRVSHRVGACSGSGKRDDLIDYVYHGRIDMNTRWGRLTTS